MNFALIGASILLLASGGSYYLVNRKNLVREQQVRWVAFVLYFWLLVFIQLIVFAAVYAVVMSH